MTKEQKILTVIIGNIVIVVSQISFGLVSNSYALIADALHNAGDVLAVGISYIAIILSTKTPTFRRTFGYMRAEMMAAFVNSVFLFVAMIVVLYEAVHKLFFPEIVAPIYMIVLGFIALLANGISAYILNNLGISHVHHGHDHDHHHHDHHHHEHEHEEKNEDANIKSAYLHMLGDALISIGVVLAGIFIYFFKIYSVDAILTIVFSIYILKQTYPLLKKSFLSLMDANIININKKDLETLIFADKNIKSYHDLHIYKPSSKHNFISLHVVFDNKDLSLEKTEKITSSLQVALETKGFNHVLIQSDLAQTAQNHICCEMED